jgi:hypothetical protein
MTRPPRLNIGNSLFICPVPLVFESRYFFVEEGKTEDLFSVFFLQDGKPLFEIYRNQPSDNPITEVTKTPVGIITVAERGTAKFLYKVRPGYKGSSVFGRIKGEETEIVIRDDKIQIGTSQVISCTIQAEVGIVVAEDGAIGIGTRLPQEVRHLFAAK